MSETEMKVNEIPTEELVERLIHRLNLMEIRYEERIIALERALEAVLTKIEDAEHPQAHGHDQPGWFGVTE
tara:strand:- start:815 stop:1027 length:213 start_codon:yes stop_codon:yes gene_type:complete